MFTGAVYICTEDVFPNKRLQQLTESFSQYHAHTHPKLTAKYLSDNIYIEHVATIVSSAACYNRTMSTCQMGQRSLLHGRRVTLGATLLLCV